ncbi:MAG TPA: OmpA family protein [Cellvibrionaceae bacterium]
MKKAALTHTLPIDLPHSAHLSIESRLEDSLLPQPHKGTREQAHQLRRLWRNNRQQLRLTADAKSNIPPNVNSRYLPVYFAIGDDQPDASSQRSLRMLGFYLCQHPTMAIRLDGYADPRGTDEYNNVLAHYRAQAVADLLIASGVDTTRITCHSHGGGLTLPEEEHQLCAAQQLAQERRVEIRLGTAACKQPLH